MSPKRWPRPSRRATRKPRRGSRRFWKSAHRKWRAAECRTEYRRHMTRAVPAHDVPLRAIKLGPADVVVVRRADGTILMRSPHALPAYPRMLTERLVHWAKVAPDRIFLAQRDAARAWRSMSYAKTLAAVRALAAALLERGLNAERPIAILSGNDIDHALIALAAMHVGIPYAPISVPYSLLSQDFGKLKTIIEILSPGFVFANNGTAFARAMTAALPRSVEVAVTVNPPVDRATTSFAELLRTSPAATVEAAHARVKPDQAAKSLFTS